jgi:hypothetical protein
VVASFFLLHIDPDFAHRTWDVVKLKSTSPSCQMKEDGRQSWDKHRLLCLCEFISGHPQGLLHRAMDAGLASSKEPYNIFLLEERQ